LRAALATDSGKLEVGVMPQEDIDKKNAAFWNELCGSGLAQSLGITDASPDNLRRFDDAFMALYPYLDRYLLPAGAASQKVLEIGLGYGTLGQILAARGHDYYGLDIAAGPVAMMRYRLDVLGQNGAAKVQVGSALAIPYASASFHCVYTIGCLHHTGDLRQAIAEVYRVLVPGGRAVVMLYNRLSFRRLVQVPWQHLRRMFSHDGRSVAERIRALYDTNSQGEVAPHTDYVSWLQARWLFRQFAHVRIEVQNFDAYVLRNGKLVLPREKFLHNVARVVGLDLYIRAQK
jgi:SAM-dependent methyltransferase